MHRCGAGVCWLLAMLMACGSPLRAQNHTSFTVAVGAAGTDSFVFGTELWAVSQLELLPARKLSIETAEVHEDAERLHRLRDGTFDFALVRNEAPTSFAVHLRGVMVLGPAGVGSASSQATQLLVHADVPEDVVYDVTRTIFEHAAKLRSAEATIGIRSPGDAIIGLAVPVHPGAHRFYQELGVGNGDDAPLMAGGSEGMQAHVTENAIWLGFDEAHQFKAACRNAAAHGVLDRDEHRALAEACNAYVYNDANSYLTDLPSGRGGPKVITRGGNTTDEPENAPLNDRDTQPPGLQPTM